MSPNDAEGMANSVDPDQTAPLGAVWSGSALFAQAYLSENLASLRYLFFYALNSLITRSLDPGKLFAINIRKIWTTTPPHKKNTVIILKFAKFEQFGFTIK